MGDVVVVNIKTKEIEAISLAYSEFNRKMRDEEYVASADYDGSNLVIIFRKESSLPGSRGNVSQNPSLEVVVDMYKMEVIHSAFAR